MSNDPLLQPYQLKHLSLKNRIMTTAHEPAYTENGMPTERYRAYHAERAKGGVAMVMTAGSAVVSRDSPPSFGNILAYRDEVVPHIRALTDACHAHGCAVMIQLTHLGWRTHWSRGDWLPVLNTSHAREPAHRAFPKQIEDWDIARIVTDYADAAERMQAGGMDGIELEAYGHLMDAFWSPVNNTLDGPYGGDLDGRMRFSLEVLQAIRARTGPDFIVGIRYTADETAPGGIDTELGLEISKRLSDSGLVDFLNVIRGRILTDPELTKVIPIQGMANAPHLDFAGRVRAATAMPTFHAARIPDVATARHAISAGLLDMVGMTRAHLAEPHIVRLIAEGRENAIRPCVGATYCLDRIYQGGEALCIHNAATGRELSMPHVIAPARARKTVTIVGAGPGGLEAARIAGERGHDVTVFEAASQPGGQLRLAARSERRREMLGIIDWRMERCAEAGVQFHFDQFVDENHPAMTASDVNIIATGGLPQTEILTDGNDLVTSTWDVIAGDTKPTGDVLIYDDAGDHSALQAAEFAARTASRLEIMTPNRAFSPDVMGMNLTPYISVLQGQCAIFTVTWRLLSVRRDNNRLTATIGTDYSPLTRQATYDHVIVNHGTRPLDDLYFALKPRSSNLGALDHDAFIAGRPQSEIRNPEGTFQLFRIGDAVASRNVHAAIYDALRLMKNV